MKNKEKRNVERKSVFTIALIVLLLLIVVIVCYVLFFSKGQDSIINESTHVELASISGEENVEYDGKKKINKSEYMESEIFLEDFIFSNFYIYSIDGFTQIEFDVLNGSSKRKKLEEYIMNVYNETEKVGEIVCTGEEFAAGQTKRLSVVVNADIANLASIELKPTYTISF